MSIDYNVVRVNLFNWATSNVPAGMPVIQLNQNGPQPTNAGTPVDYVSIYISSATQIGFDYVQSPADDTGISNQFGDREFTLSVQAYGGNAMTVLENLRTSLQKSSVLSSLRAVGLVYVDWYPIIDLTQLIDSRYQYRAAWDSRWRIAQLYTDNPGVIDTAVVTETIKDQSGTVVFTKTITIPQP
jgi:hypothetical protein